MQQGRREGGKAGKGHTPHTLHTLVPRWRAARSVLDRGLYSPAICRRGERDCEFASLDVAEEAGDSNMVCRVTGQLHQNLELTGKLLGDLGVWAR